MVPPQQPLPSIEQLIEGWIRAMREMHDTFDTASIAYLCQTNQLTPAERAKLVELQSTVTAFKSSIDEAFTTQS